MFSPTENTIQLGWQIITLCMWHTTSRCGIEVPSGLFNAPDDKSTSSAFTLVFFCPGSWIDVFQSFIALWCAYVGNMRSGHDIVVSTIMEI